MIFLLSSVIFTLITIGFLVLSPSQHVRKPPVLSTVALGVFVIAWLVSFFIYPSLSFSESPIYICFIVFAGLGVLTPYLVDPAYYNNKNTLSRSSTFNPSVSLYCGSVFILLLVFIITSTAILNADKFRQRLALTETEVFNASETLIDAQQGRYIC